MHIEVGDDRATIFGALIWMAGKLRSDQSGRARTLWSEKGKEALATEWKEETPTVGQTHRNRA
ncbi:hypothetical protein CHELA40_10731 [Chelatococcus asaccharovorans]|nr:hypothetical protein CHELA40_10731 [Chelatococcus asaccharovorans]CAH1686177.1 hypothetical protein CHELA17_64876 [Chelatococcus asaccharovorans]